MEFKRALFALIIMGMVIASVGVWVGDWNDKYDSGLAYDLDEYNKLDEMSSYALASEGSIAPKGSVDTGSGDFEGVSLRGAFAIINNIFAPFSVVFGEGGLLDSISDRWGIPSYIMTGFISMMMLTIIFSIIALFFRRPTTTA